MKFFDFFYVFLVLLDIQTKEKLETNVATLQPESENIESARSYTTDNSTTKTNEIAKSNIGQGILKFNYSQKSIEQFIFSSIF